VIVYMHHHPLPMGSTWLDGVALRDAAEFWP
jgi:3',5'-cyclic AMP phosphodiesterase CpdA